MLLWIVGNGVQNRIWRCDCCPKLLLFQYDLKMDQVMNEVLMKISISLKAKSGPTDEPPMAGPMSP